jgi:hypothetical protein
MWLPECAYRPAHLVVEQQRHVRVRRVAREHLDVPLGEPRGELPRDVAADPLEVRQPGRVPLPPHDRRPGERLGIGARGFELAPVGLGPRDAVVQVGDEPGLEPVVGELLEEDGGEADRERRPRLVQRRPADHVEQGQVGFGGGLVEPRFAVRVAPVVQDVREVPVEDDAERAERIGHDAGIVARAAAPCCAPAFENLYTDFR